MHFLHHDRPKIWSLHRQELVAAAHPLHDTLRRIERERWRSQSDILIHSDRRIADTGENVEFQLRSMFQFLSLHRMGVKKHPMGSALNLWALPSETSSQLVWRRQNLCSVGFLSDFRLTETNALLQTILGHNK